MSRTLLLALTALVFAAASYRTYTQALGKHVQVGESRTTARSARASAALPRGTAGAEGQSSSTRSSGSAPEKARGASEPPASQGVLGRFRNSLSQAKSATYEWLRARHLGSVARIIDRTKSYLLAPRSGLWLLFFLLLERLIPAKPIRSLLSVNKLQDFLYPVFSPIVKTLVLLVGYEPVRSLFASSLPLADTKLLDGLPMFWQGLGAFLALDLTHWLSHYARHKIKWLWHFHSIHHSQVELNPLTAFRTHPLEGFLVGSLALIPTAVLGGDRSAWIAVSVIYAAIWPMLTHSNLRTNLGPLRYVLVSPQFHRVHHSVDPKQYDLNFGEHVILWDWLFGTMWKDANSYPDTGIPGGQFIEERSRNPLALAGMWAKHCVYPFLMIGRSILGAAIGRPAPGDLATLRAGSVTSGPRRPRREAFLE